MRRFVPVLTSLLLLGMLLFVSARSSAEPAAAAKKHAQPSAQALHSEFVFEVKLTADKPWAVGEAPRGVRRVIPLASGTLTGPKLKGQVVSGGADYQTVAADGTVQIDARYPVQTEDGTFIVLNTRGVRRGPKDVLDKLGRGEQVDPSQYYFRLTAEVEAPTASKHAWLNNTLFVGVGERLPTGVSIRFYEVK